MLPNDMREYKVHTKPSRVEHWRHLVEIVALITAAAWGFYVFVYQERIKPAGEPPRLQVSTNVTHEALQSGKELVTIKVTLKNTGSTDIAMATLLVNAYGIRYESEDAHVLQEIHPAAEVTIENRGLRNANPTLLYSHLSLWTPFGMNLRDLRLPISEELTFSQPFVIKRQAYETLRLTYAYCYQRSDDRAATTYTPGRAPDGAFDIRNVLAADHVHAGLHCGGTLAYLGEYAL
jgi:hypothetical protein